MMWRRKKGEKYGRKKVEHHGYRFDSQLERALFDQLKLRERAGEIKDLQAQDTVYLTDARIMMKPDFAYTDCATGAREWAEAKGFETTDYRIKRRLWKFYGPGPLHVYGGSASRLVFKETILPKGGECERETSA
jgi:hypothetical protein